MIKMHESKKLLILDDDDGVARTIALIGGREGFDVRICAQHTEFFACVNDWEPGYLAIDLVMPGMDGVEVLRNLAEQGCKARIVITSGMGAKVLESARRSADERGLHITGILPKPFKAAELRQLLADVRRPAPKAAGMAKAAPLPSIGERDVTDAFAHRQFFLQYQPKLELAGNCPVGFEALVRWRHPSGALIPPDHFIPFLERSEHIQSLTDYVFEDALKWFVGVSQQSSTRLTLSINLSARNLVDIHLADRLHSRCAWYGVPPGSVILELTETSAMANPADALDILTRLRIKGFALGIDDFGTGYSSMVQLARMPFSELKIDKSFIFSMAHSQESRKIVASTIQLARSLGLTSVAEGIEDAATAAVLRDLGCNLAQGYHFGRPMDGPDAAQWLDRRASLCL